MAKFIQIFDTWGSKAFNTDHIEMVQVHRHGNAKDGKNAAITVEMNSGKTHKLEWDEAEYGNDSWELAEYAYHDLTGLPGEEA